MLTAALRAAAPLLFATATRPAAAAAAADALSAAATGLQQRRFLADKAQHPVYLVFGASGGIGSALVEQLTRGSAGGGAAVVLAGRDERKLQATAEKSGAAASGGGGGGSGGGGGVVMPCDALDPTQVENVVSEVMSKYGRLDGVASCVGNVVAGSASTTSLEHFKQTLDINLVTAFNVTKAATKVGRPDTPRGAVALQRSAMAMAMAAAAVVAAAVVAAAVASAASIQSYIALLNQSGGGSLVLVSAAVAETGVPHFEAMSAAKAGVEGLARATAATYADRGIRVNCVAPGLTRTRQTEQFTEGSPAVRDASRAMVPASRHRMTWRRPWRSSCRQTAVSSTASKQQQRQQRQQHQQQQQRQQRQQQQQQQRQQQQQQRQQWQQWQRLFSRLRHPRHRAWLAVRPGLRGAQEVLLPHTATAPSNPRCCSQL
ncbi:hypothetical protein PLESTB_000775100 [Pleodorina starrii]|uniref:Ketoreductase domain-containing protein n=1 Tax=Pleodorina starrii TaxID=330485 RepID=A0A9W6BKB9_9CHLO|nr:hypothetical protein PLESTM_000430100 [Pleodorina starrii]GLC53674.1 hypothetical protein PLESTB_000775100 [Pleodorina starrii]